MWWRWRSQIGPQGGYEFPAGRAVGGGVHQFIRKQTMIRLCALRRWRGSHWLQPTVLGFPLLVP